MAERGETGSIVTLICDSGDRYLDTYYDTQWIEDNIGDLTPYNNALDHFSDTSVLNCPAAK